MNDPDPCPRLLRLRRRRDGILAQLVTHHSRRWPWGHPGARPAGGTVALRCNALDDLFRGVSIGKIGGAVSRRTRAGVFGTRCGLHEVGGVEGGQFRGLVGRESEPG
jgi:hypothetical protein